MDPVAALEHLGGVSRWPRLAALGVGRSTLLDACEAGAILRPARGLFCLPARRHEIDVRVMAARGQLSCGLAARAHGLELFTGDAAIHVRVPVAATRASEPRDVVLHRWGRIGTSEITPLLETLQDCTRCLPVPEAVAVLDSALRSRHIDRDDLVGAAATWPTRSRCLVALTDAQAQSVLESVGRSLLVLSSVGHVTSQVRVALVGWVDLVVDGWLVVELDGWATHQHSFREDRRRDAELTRRGFVVLRFTYPDLLHRREWFLEVVRDCLARGRPPFAQVADADDSASSSADTPWDEAG